MDINSTLASQQYAASMKVAQPDPSNGQITNGLSKTLVGFSEVMSGSEKTAMAALSGKADPHALVQALAQTELAIETAVTVRDKVVEAYQEILRMPI